MNKIIDDKFSSNISENMLYSEMERFIYHLAWRYNSSTVIMMSMEEIAGELWLEVVKGMQYYSGKQMSDENKKAVLRRICDNRIAELRHKYYGTHRKLSKTDTSVETLEQEGLDVEETASNIESMDVEQIRSQLSERSQKVFDALVDAGNEGLNKEFYAVALRASASGKNPHISPHVIANGLGIKETEAKQAFREIKKVYREVICQM